MDGLWISIILLEHMKTLKNFVRFQKAENVPVEVMMTIYSNSVNC